MLVTFAHSLAESGRRWGTMKVLLQDKRSGCYYRGDGIWTEHLRDAFDFQFSRGLRDFSDKLDGPDAQLVVAMDEPPRPRAGVRAGN